MDNFNSRHKLTCSFKIDFKLRVIVGVIFIIISAASYFQISLVSVFSESVSQNTSA